VKPSDDTVTGAIQRSGLSVLTIGIVPFGYFFVRRRNDYGPCHVPSLDLSFVRLRFSLLLLYIYLLLLI